MERKYKYYPEDFPELKVKDIHYGLVFDVYDEHTDVNTKISFITKEETSQIELDAKKIEISEVMSENELTWKHDKKKNKLIINFKKSVGKDKAVTIQTKNTIKPTKNDLEGMYYDKTPSGAPPQMITQCQQWGFQKLTPSFDSMNGKATYKTKIIADKRYTHLISNGNIAQEGEENGKKTITYVNEDVPMAPYLFFLGVGTWKETNRELEYANGKKFNLQMLTLENATTDATNKSLEILAFGVQWINIFTGAKRHKDIAKRKEIFDLCFLRDKLKAQGKEKEFQEAQSELVKLSKGVVFGYEYSGDVYREIAMQNSNFGGMENVGNTTITANRMLPFKEMSDRVFSYLLNVKTHEFYHNLNGSEVSSYSPFDLWLNEAITEYTTGEEFISFASSIEDARLDNVSRIVMRGGTFDEDTGALGHKMRPEGFNMPDELITGITYSKGPEFIRMVKLVIGEDKFYSALQKYHEKYSNSNAKTQDWINTMEKETGISISKMADAWLNQTGYPIVKINTKFDEENKKATIEIEQTGFEKDKHWEFPFSYAIFDKEGNKVFENIEIVKDQKATFIVDNVKSIGFFSFNRELSFYGKIEYGATENELLLQIENDDDVIAKYLALYSVIEKERMVALKEKNFAVDEKVVDIYYKLLSNEDLMEKLGTEIISIPGGVEDKYLRHYYEELYTIGKDLRKRIATKYEKELLDIYKKTNDKKFEGEYVEKSFKEIKNRSVKNSCLGILSELETNKVNDLILKQYRGADNQTDKLVAFALYNDSNAKNRLDILEEFEKESIGNPVQWEQFLSLVSRGDAKDTLAQVKRIKASNTFNITQSNDQRALLMGFAMNKRKSLLTKEGLEFFKETTIELAKLNEYTTNHLLSVFEELEYMKEEELADYVKVLIEVRKELSFEEQPSVYNNIKRTLDSAPRAIKAYEEKYEKLKL
ncbi:MAG: DUF3458 domain-containing protein [Candidatus Diapherotrites archaeon]|jgi:aminopeptidase N|uniref:DUF3458 domain-containing protein n=1 Tax=Candidatus Iainarchaeum sp. TaxID=3101447 RepID=A0A8T5GGP6_9ARCH|nr:DUF3458 domain-containing protein [Candidatus Diapherotrites archaeon]MBT7241275.1 DUF3458 domain-containing protein [Candidatus Diapherotrites archaeon]